MALPVSISLVRSPLTAPILDGQFVIGGITLKINEAKSVNRNSQEMLDGVYDVAEMSLATYFKAREDGLPLIGLPIFTGRRFVHSGIHTRAGFGVSSPEQLAGRCICVPQYWMTSSVWHRILLSEEYGVRADQVRWITTSRERLKTADYPPDIDITLVDGVLPGDLLAEGVVDAVLVPKRGGRMMGSAPYETPFDDIVGAQRGSYTKTGIFPIMHFIVMRAPLADEIPTLPSDIREIFGAAKTTTLNDAQALAGMESPLWGETVENALPLFGGDPWPYGIAANRPTLEAIQTSLLEQGFIHTRMPMETLFAAQTGFMEEVS